VDAYGGLDIHKLATVEWALKDQSMSLYGLCVFVRKIQRKIKVLHVEGWELCTMDQKGTRLTFSAMKCPLIVRLPYPAVVRGKPSGTGGYNLRDSVRHALR
jgi:hypothetical protein